MKDVWFIDALASDALASDVSDFLGYIVRQRRLTENTRLVYQRGLTRFAAFVHSGGIADYLTPQSSELAGYLESLHRLAPASRSMAATALRSFYQWLVGQGRLSANAARPVQALACPAIGQRLPKVLTPQQVRRLLDAPDKMCRLYWLHKALLEFLYASACRASEVSDLRMENVDLDAATARVTGKGNKERMVLLGEPAVQALHSYIHLLRPDLIRQQSVPPPWMFVSRTGRRLDREYIWMLVNGCAAKAGLPQWVGAHTLRHTAATHILAGGAGARFVQEILGHSSLATTATYLHLDLSQLRRVHERFEAWRCR
jgi:integrase/recombinase XerD